MAEPCDAALLSDLAALKLEQGDADGAQELFRKALEQRQQDGADAEAGAPASAAADAEEQDDSWEAWDEATVPVALPPPPKPPAAAADSWEAVSAAAAAAAPRSRGAAAPAGPAAADFGGSDDAPLQFGGGHVLEFYGLTPAVRTQHLEEFMERHARGHAAPPTLKWVDDCHAAVVCPDPAAARQLLAAATARGGGEFQLRSYADAGSGTRRLPGSELLPPKPRPKTSAAVARRLIGGALNMKLRDRDAEQQLTAARRQQRQEREEREQAAEAAWDG
ncbi:coiled-coil domain-containing R3HCC1L [Micractinium conductrix]|uniref:Coiled-coil domain-containing R3HCC1L n=1 Tax=Micractinium conductrix TaxID=554055 RepID=A0A2P6VJP6_9CHLO|nr:coiled-coil domain-containing R3HCC1L [Micractinium conductrix]|eukprot:PSC74313.1 coiled-coil domain-containing R3HCC1L [Micractinium conductrix]